MTSPDSEERFTNFWLFDLGPDEEDGDEPHPGGDGPNRPLRGPAARYQRAAEEDGGVRGEELSTELHPERAVLHRPAGPTGLHHGGRQRWALLQPSRHRGDSSDGSCEWGKREGDTWGFMKICLCFITFCVNLYF